MGGERCVSILFSHIVAGAENSLVGVPIIACYLSMVGHQNHQTQSITAKVVRN